MVQNRQRRFFRRRAMCSQWSVLSLFAEIFTGSSTTSWNFLKLEASRLTPTTCSWETTSIEGTTLSRQSLFWFVSKSGSRKELPFCAEIMNRGKLLKSMVFTTSALGNMEMPMSGSTTLIFLIYCLWQLWLRTRSSVSTEVCRQILTLWTK